jgi:hypothetical protein
MIKPKELFFFLLLLFWTDTSLCVAAELGRDTIVMVDIYYYGWDVMTRARLELDDVRKGNKIKTTIYSSDEIASFIDWLNLDDMKKVGNPRPEDPRLVIDFIDEEQNRYSYYASRFSLLNENSTIRRPIDDTFRKRFTFADK